LHTLQELQSGLFSHPPIRIINYSADGRFLAEGDLLKKHFDEMTLPHMESLGAKTLLEQKVMARGLHPIMLVKFGIVFQSDMNGETLLATLGNLDKPVEYEYWTAFGSMVQVKQLVETLTPVLKDRSGIARRNPHNDDMDLFYDVAHGEHLYQFYYSLNPIPSPGMVC
jgi:hypothetical protein